MQLELNQREPFDRRNASSVGWEAKHGWKKKGRICTSGGEEYAKIRERGRRR